MGIEIKNLSYTYHDDSDYQALDNISLKIPTHHFNAVIGETGSGKTTLMQHLNGLIKIQQGEIIIDEFDLCANQDVDIKGLRKKVGYVFQFPEYQLFEDTVLKDVAFGPKNFGLSEEEARVQAINSLRLVGIDESLFESSPFDLSGGQKRKVAIAGVLAINPDIIILDEPTAGLDPIASKEMMELLKRLQVEAHKTIVMVTHDLEHVYKYADYVSVLNEGKVLYNGEQKTFFQNDELLGKLSLDLPMEVKLKQLLKAKGFKVKGDCLKTIIKEVAKEVKRHDG